MIIFKSATWVDPDEVAPYPDEVAPNEPPHLNLNCLLSSP